MRILFTGASSFTGYWFVRELVAGGHEVIAACRGDGRYEGLRAERVRMVRGLCETRFARGRSVLSRRFCLREVRDPAPVRPLQQPLACVVIFRVFY
jgi:nucleoside-diphosphate-sugar epimerase